MSEFSAVLLAIKCQISVFNDITMFQLLSSNCQKVILKSAAKALSPHPAGKAFNKNGAWRC